jgi:glycosyltransferase involved in cell wall biosynthesis
MIYVDVTGACLLPLQSGIPRTTRGVYRLLGDRFSGEITPVFWQPFRGGYTQLSSRARTLLQDPFAACFRTKRAPRDSTLPLLWASFSDLFRAWPPTVPLPQRMRPDDTLLLTSLFPDNRLEYLERLASAPGLKIAIFHDAIPLRDPNVVAWEKKRHLKTLRLLSKLDAVIAVSQATADDLNALWLEHRIIARASVFVIPWPVPFTARRPDFTEPPWTKKRILYVSRLKQVKNHATLFSACLKLWGDGIDFELEIIGCEDEARESRAIVRALTQLQRAGKPVFWRGHVTEDELHQAYQRATFTVFPSLAEGFGLPIIESFWHGRPVVCSDRDPMGELARNGGCLTTDVQDVHSLAAAMQSLLENQAQCLALAKQAYARPLRTWSDYWRELQPVLENR